MINCLIVLSCIIAFLPYILIQYVHFLNYQISSLIGFFIWFSLVMVIQILSKWKREYRWIFLFGFVASGPLLFLLYIMLSFVLLGGPGG